MWRNMTNGTFIPGDYVTDLVASEVSAAALFEP
jgi:hypothetical protein